MSHYTLRKLIADLRSLIECGIVIACSDVPLVSQDDEEEFFAYADLAKNPPASGRSGKESEVVDV